jgi:pyruvate, orthophosphate dikinase
VCFFKSINFSKLLDILGSKGANLCELMHLGVSVPPAFTVSTTASLAFNHCKQTTLSSTLKEDITQAVHQLEAKAEKFFGATSGLSFPLLLSARASVPGNATLPTMMPSVLYLGLNDHVIQYLIKSHYPAQWVYTTYMKFIRMFGTAVLQIPASAFEEIIEDITKHSAYPPELFPSHLFSLKEIQQATTRMKAICNIPDDPLEQLFMTIEAIYQSWQDPKSLQYKDMHGISESLGTAVTVQTMVYGNLNIFSGIGVVTSRHPVTGIKEFCGQYMANAEVTDDIHFVNKICFKLTFVCW